jgi:SAM-dependent methyltransferase
MLPPLAGPLEVLDVGCGNGRFGIFLEEKLQHGIAYCGTDASQALLDHALGRLPESATLLRHDLLESPVSSTLGPRRFDLIAVYGVLHHIQGFAKRIEVLQDLRSLLRPEGLLAVSLWQWREHPRLSRRIVPWPKVTSLDPMLDELRGLEPEDADHLLRWGKEGVWIRYCHHFTDLEVEKIIETLAWPCLSDTRGEGGLNRYLVLRPAHEKTTIDAELGGGRSECES